MSVSSNADFVCDGASSTPASFIPIIDITRIDQGSAMVTACLQHGFFYVDNRHQQLCDHTLVQQLMSMAQQFFALPIEIKEKYAIEKSAFHRGYVGPNSARKPCQFHTNNSNFIPASAATSTSTIDPSSPSHSSGSTSTSSANFNEGFFFAAAQLFRNPSAHPLTDDGNQYPAELNPSFRSLLQRYFNICWDMNTLLLTHLKDYLNLNRVRTANGEVPKDWKDLFMGRMYTSRFLHYAPNQGVLTAHTDFAVLTILHQDLNGGLQIHHNDRWMDVPPIENTFLINVGDMLQHWSEGQLKSTAHRVIYHGNNPRYSFPFFIHLDKGCEILMDDMEATERRGQERERATEVYDGSSVGRWENSYRYVTQKYYYLVRYLNENVTSSENCLHNKSPAEIDEFHRQVIDTLRRKNQSMSGEN